jgi:hypothetical protein
MIIEEQAVPMNFIILIKKLTMELQLKEYLLVIGQPTQSTEIA